MRSRNSVCRIKRKKTASSQFKKGQLTVVLRATAQLPQATMLLFCQEVFSPSAGRSSVSLALQLSIMSHSRTVRSQEELARTAFTGLKLRQLTGPSWPPRTFKVICHESWANSCRKKRVCWSSGCRTSSRRPVCIDHRKISKES